DDPLVVKMYRNVLSFEGFKIETAPNGAEGMKKAGDFMPDLIFLDIMMPKMNGIDVLTNLKKDPNLKDIPVIVLTNLAGADTAEEALKKGAFAYMVKSEYKPKEVAQKAKDFFDKRAPKAPQSQGASLADVAMNIPKDTLPEDAPAGLKTDGTGLGVSDSTAYSTVKTEPVSVADDIPPKMDDDQDKSTDAIATASTTNISSSVPDVSEKAGEDNGPEDVISEITPDLPSASVTSISDDDLSENETEAEPVQPLEAKADTMTMESQDTPVIGSVTDTLSSEPAKTQPPQSVSDEPVVPPMTPVAVTVSDEPAGPKLPDDNIGSVGSKQPERSPSNAVSSTTPSTPMPGDLPNISDKSNT
ncbi:response regulator, partial [Candidatus Woesebacteria bacterium]|nr:response regulator [Candidatus Woesebacteria bacterium]